jgi:hypothetical protein
MRVDLRAIAIRLVLVAGLASAAATSYVGWYLDDQVEFGPVQAGDAATGRTFVVTTRNLDNGITTVMVDGIATLDAAATTRATLAIELVDGDGLVLASEQVEVAGAQASFVVAYSPADPPTCPGDTCSATFTVRVQRVDTSSESVEVSGTFLASAEGDGSDPPEGAELSVSPR